MYHVWNRAAGRLRMFSNEKDYLAFERVLVEAHQRHPLASAGLVLDAQSLAFGGRAG